MEAALLEKTKQTIQLQNHLSVVIKKGLLDIAGLAVSLQWQLQTGCAWLIFGVGVV